MDVSFLPGSLVRTSVERLRNSFCSRVSGVVAVVALVAVVVALHGSFAGKAQTAQAATKADRASSENAKSGEPAEHRATVAADAAKGQRLFVQYGCSECHLSKGQGARSTGARLGPPQIPQAAFVNYVREPTGEMPPYTRKTVSDEELADMYAFLQLIPPTPSWKTIPLLNQ
jgi:cytochrome c5